MIISDRHKFAFVHIPKCGGTSIRSIIGNLDEREEDFQRKFERQGLTREFRVPGLGVVNYQHIPLFILEAMFPDEKEAIENYNSFACIRNPFDRFSSSYSQYLRRRVVKSNILSAEHFIEHLPPTINALKSLGGKRRLFPIEFSAFQPQVDFLYLDGQRIVKNIYSIKKIPNLLQEVERMTGSDLKAPKRPPRQNVSVTYRNGLVRKMIRVGRPLSSPARAMLPDAMLKKLRSLVYVPRDQRLRNLFRSGLVEDFVAEFYQQDIALWQELGDAA